MARRVGNPAHQIDQRRLFRRVGILPTSRLVNARPSSKVARQCRNKPQTPERGAADCGHPLPSVRAITPC